MPVTGSNVLDWHAVNNSEAGRLGYQKTKTFFDKRNKEVKAEARRRHAEKNPKCKFCLAPIAYEKRQNNFCNHACAARFHNPRKGTGLAVQLYCRFCNKPTVGIKLHCEYCITKGYHYHRKSCSQLSSPTALRKYLLTTRKHICSVCNYSEWNGKKIPLEVDHINGKPYDNDEANVRLICPNCHAQTPTFKARNKGHGRTIVRRNGQSKDSEKQA